MKKLNMFIFLVLVVLLLTPLSGTSQVSHKEDLTCYTRTELQVIAAKLLKGLKLEEDVRLDSLTILELRTIVTNLEKNVTDYKEIIRKDSIYIEDRNTQIFNLNKDLTKSKRRLKWTKVGWVTTTTFLTGLLGYVIITK